MNRKLAALLMIAVFAMMAFAVLHGSRSPTGFAVNDETAENLPPVWTANITTFVIGQGAGLVLNLGDYFADPEGMPLTYIATQTENLDIMLDDDLLKITPEPAFVGERVVSIIASDGESVTTKRIRIDVVAGQQPELPQMPTINETLPERIANETVPEPVANETLIAPEVQEARVITLNAAVNDESGRVVGKKVSDEPDYETFFTFVGKENGRFVVRFYHNSSIALPVWVEGNVSAEISSQNAEPLEEVEVSVPLRADGSIPLFRLHIGEESEVFEFGIQDYHITDVPTLDGVILNTTNPLTNDTNQNLTAYPINSVDPTGYAVKNITDFLVNNRSFAVLYAPFENNTDASSKALDYSAFRNNGSVVGATFNVSPDFRRRGTYQFDSESDLLNFSNPASLIITGNLTIIIWANISSLQGGAYDNLFISKGGNGETEAENYPYWFNIESSGTLTAFWEYGSGSDTTVYSTTPASTVTNQWHQYAFTRDVDTNTVRFYYDGAQLGNAVSYANDATGGTVGNVVVGRDDTWPTYDFKGLIDEVMIFNRTLSAQQIAEIFNEQNNTGIPATIVSQETKIGEVWQACITPNNGLVDGITACSNNVTIQEEPVYLPVLFLNYTTPTPANNTQSYNRSVQINVSANVESNLSSFKYDWNGTNYSIYNDSLVLMFNFDNRSALGESGAKVVDISKYGNDGTVYNAVWNAIGKYEGAYEFDSGDDVILFGNNKLPTGSEPRTVMMWLNLTSSDDSQEILGWGSNVANQRFAVYYDGTENLMYLETAGDSVSMSYPASYRNNWHHVAVVYPYTEGTVGIYLDGVFKNSKSMTIATTSNTPRISGIQGVPGYEFYGKIDEVRIWNVSLSDAEIYEQYVSNLNKFNTTGWNFIVNQSKNSTTDLDYGNYTYYACGADTTGQSNCTETRFLSITQEAEVLYNFSNISVTKTDNSDPVNVSTNLTYQINFSSTGNGTAYNITVNDTYPPQVIYLTSQPTPVSGTNNTWILGNLTQGANISINITVLVLNISDSVVINNTVNVTFQNETSNNLSVNAIASTTVLVPPPTLTKVDLNTTNPLTNDTNQNLTAFVINAVDPTGFPVQNITDWRRNGTSIAVLNLPFDTNVSSVEAAAVRDYSTFARNQTLGDGSLSNSPNWTASGRVGGAYLFDGVNDIITGNISNISNAITVEAWVKHNSVSGIQRYVTIESEIAVLRIQSGQFHFYIKTSGTLRHLYAGSPQVGQWYHIVGTWDGTTQRLYINGQQATSQVPGGTLDAIAGTVLIGASGEDINGLLDEVKVYNRALSATQVWQNFVDGNASRHVQTIVSNETSIGDKWSVAVTPNNGIVDGITLFSNNVTILSLAPYVGFI
ncbi:MAG: LamG-like jellyroll fold domain-containing protein, partial [Candidatus Woesearchaeota archaeon]